MSRANNKQSKRSIGYLAIESEVALPDERHEADIVTLGHDGPRQPDVDLVGARPAEAPPGPEHRRVLPVEDVPVLAHFTVYAGREVADEEARYHHAPDEGQYKGEGTAARYRAAALAAKGRRAVVHTHGCQRFSCSRQLICKRAFLVIFTASPPYPH
jgi:hypothetical protein